MLRLRLLPSAAKDGVLLLVLLNPKECWSTVLIQQSSVHATRLLVFFSPYHLYQQPSLTAFQFENHNSHSIPNPIMAPPITFRLSLVRHGQTAFNASNVLQGQIDTPISEAGKEEAMLFGQSLVPNSYQIIYSSSLSRAYDTAKQIAVFSGHTGVEIQKHALLIERSYGSMEGMSREVLRALALAKGITTMQFTPVDGESMEQVTARIIDFLQSHLFPDVNRRSAVTNFEVIPSVLIVTHGAIIRLFIAYLASFGDINFPAPPDASPPFTAVSEFELTFDTTNSISQCQWQIINVKCLRLYDTSHLNV